MHKEIILLITRVDRHSVAGYCGGLIAMISPFMDMINSAIQIAAGIGGLVLLFYGIRHKQLLVRKELKELQKNEKED